MTASKYSRPPLKVALMGLGRAMFTEHVPVFRDHPSLFEVVAACDVVKTRRDMLLSEFPRCRMFRQFEDMLFEKNIDLVVIATGSSRHVEHATAALRRGVWVLLETPMAHGIEEAARLRGAAAKANMRLVAYNRGFFSPDFLLAKQVVAGGMLGDIHTISVRRDDFVRRDDWQTMRHLGGGAAYYAMPDLILQALKLLPLPPVMMWSELKRSVSVGDAEDFVHLRLKTRRQITADIEYDGGFLGAENRPSFTIRGSRGVFAVMPGEKTGVLRAIPADFSFPRRRASVKVQPIADMHERFPVVEEKVSLAAGTLYGQSVFWRRLYETVRVASAFPVPLEDAFECERLAHLMKKSSQFGN
ncbi:MAG: Gfo/Idh/MocA family oxidoreductase [Kiritimatiellae bacterium]|nr:Gfo/Idh/MocA family oxidoreductase [Kiritimatiellia bacterium]